MKQYLQWKAKIAIVDEAYSQDNNVKPTARKYNVSPAQIRRWMKQKASLADRIDQIGHCKVVQKGRPAKNAASFDSLRSFIHQLESQDRSITVGMICRELKRIDSSEASTDMAVIRQRVYRFLQNEKFVQRRATHVAQNTRYDQDQISQFVEYVTEEIQRLGIGPDCVVNIDETNVDFDMTGNVTLARKGSRTVSIRSTGSSNRVSVLLGVTMSGTKLEPFLIFKGKPTGRIIREFAQMNYPEGCVYTVQQKAWIDEESFSVWIEKIWKPFCESRPQTYLIMDQCKVHMMNSIVGQLQDVGTEVEFILAGYTSKLQVLDVGINKPFKDYLRSAYEDYMVTNTENKAPSRVMVSQWIETAWNSITDSSIVNTWKGVGYNSNIAEAAN
jgi:transposase-like protein